MRAKVIPTRVPTEPRQRAGSLKTPVIYETAYETGIDPFAFDGSIRTIVFSLSPRGTWPRDR